LSSVYLTTKWGRKSENVALAQGQRVFIELNWIGFFLSQFCVISHLDLDFGIFEFMIYFQLLSCVFAGWFLSEIEFR